MLALYGRPETWNWLLMFHVLAAFLLVGGLLTATIAGFAATRPLVGDREPRLHRVALLTNLLLVLPAVIAIHILGSALADREFPGDEPDWVGIGFALGTFTFIFVLVLAALQYWVLRRSRRGRAGWPAHVTAYLAAAVLAAQLVSVFVMTGKPG